MGKYSICLSPGVEGEDGEDVYSAEAFSCRPYGVWIKWEEDEGPSKWAFYPWRRVVWIKPLAEEFDPDKIA